MHIFRAFIVLAIATFALPTQAQLNEAIKSFNAQSYLPMSERVDGARVLMTETLNADNPSNEAVLLFETAHILSLTGNSHEILAATERLLALPHNETHPIIEDRELLDAFANLQTETNKDTLARMAVAYEAVATMPPTQLSQTASRLLVKTAFDTGNWKLAHRISSASRRQLTPLKETYPNQFIDARMLESVSDYLRDPKSTHHSDMIHIIGEIASLTENMTKQERINSGFEDLDWTAQAWELVIGAYLDSSGKDPLNEKQKSRILDSYTSKNADATDKTETSVKSPPFCEGQLIKKRKLRYPRNALHKGMVGGVIIGHDFDSDGMVVNPEVKASVPFNVFEEDILKAVSTWYWKPNKNQTDTDCVLSYQGVIMPFEFVIR